MAHTKEIAQSQYIDPDGYPILVPSPEVCCGCFVCRDICPSGAIGVRNGSAGAMYPEVDHTKCIKCYRCLRTCFYK